MPKTEQLGPIETRTFRFKQPAVEFFCPLCRTARAITVHYKLTAFHYLQMAVICSTLGLLLWPLVGIKSIFSFFLVWVAFEGTLRLLWRREIPCPHCGFDASWYKTDVKVARRRVEEFWRSRPGFGEFQEGVEEGKSESKEEKGPTHQSQTTQGL